MRRSAGRLGLLIAAVALAGAVGCAESAITAPTFTGAGSGGTSGTGGALETHDPALVGTWSRTVVFQDAAGNVQSSQTVWAFGADGSATRTVIATNLSAGITDTITSRGSWYTEGSVAVITWLPPASGTISFSYAVSGTTLVLGGTAYTRGA